MIPSLIIRLENFMDRKYCSRKNHSRKHSDLEAPLAIATASATVHAPFPNLSAVPNA
jgi:hypothetical protein